MLFETILISLTFITLVIGSYTDIKTREVPDWLNYALIFSALGIRTIFSITDGYQIILSGIIGFIVCFLIANLFYYTKQWGGGDSKLLMGLGAIIGISYPITNTSFNLLLFFLLLLFIGAIYGLIWMLTLAIKHFQTFWPQFRLKLNENSTTHYILLGSSLLFLILTFFLPLLWPLIILPPLFLYLFIFITLIEQNFFYKDIAPDKLTEGDWLNEEVVVNSIKILAPKTLELEDINRLKLLQKQNKLKTVLIKEGIPFVPSFLLAYLVLILTPKIISLFPLFLR